MKRRSKGAGRLAAVPGGAARLVRAFQRTLWDRRICGPQQRRRLDVDGPRMPRRRRRVVRGAAIVRRHDGLAGVALVGGHPLPEPPARVDTVLKLPRPLRRLHSISTPAEVPAQATQQAAPGHRLENLLRSFGIEHLMVGQPFLDVQQVRHLVGTQRSAGAAQPLDRPDQRAFARRSPPRPLQTRRRDARRAGCRGAPGSQATRPRCRAGGNRW